MRIVEAVGTLFRASKTIKEPKARRETRWGLLAAVTALPLLSLLTACERGANLSEVEARERASRLYRNAMDDFQSGRTEPAIAGFTRVIQLEPGNYSAHFQLATILQDVKKDYIGAMIHYRQYLTMRPDADKAPVAEERAKMCESLYKTDLIKNGSAIDKEIQAELDTLRATRDKLQAELTKATSELTEAKSRIATLEQDVSMQKRLLRKIAAMDDSGQESGQLKAALGELKASEEGLVEPERRSIRPTDEELLDDDTPSPRIADTAEYKAIKAELQREEAEDEDDPRTHSMKPEGAKSDSGSSKPKLPEKPKTYVVQEGETLIQIARRFYGSPDWRKIREANKATIDPDGRVRAGQTIVLP